MLMTEEDAKRLGATPRQVSTPEGLESVQDMCYANKAYRDQRKAQGFEAEWGTTGERQL